MNLPSDFRNATLEGLRDVLEAWWARINTIWKKEHDATTGGHTNVTANSVTVDESVTVGESLTVNESLTVGPADPDIQADPTLLFVGTDDFGDRFGLFADATLQPVIISGIVRPDSLGQFSGVEVTGTVTPAAVGQSAYGALLRGRLTEASSGTHPMLASVVINAPSIIGGSATVTNTAALHVPGPAIATVTGRNWAIYVEDGDSRFSDVIVADGGQIQFPATQNPSSNANTLDDYEEGTFTPTSPNISYAGGAVTYQKIGKWVHVTGFVTFPATADANQAAINNLPFTCANATEARGGCVCHFSNSGALAGLMVVNNTTSAVFLNPATTGSLTNASLTGATVVFDFKYVAIQ